MIPSSAPAGGSPLPLDELVRTTLFHRHAFEGTESTSFGVALPGSAFPLLSQGDHPTLGTPSWYFHPCESAAAVEEIMNELGDQQIANRILRWMEAWFMVHEAVIVAASRTPVGSLNGTLKSFTATQLGTAALKHALSSKNIDPKIVEEVYFGNVVQAGVGQSPARQVALNAGLSPSSDATTINKVCASGMKSIMLAAQAIQTGDRSVVVAGGMESMSNAPFLLPRQNPAFGKFTTIDSLENDGLWDVYNNQAMGNCGESAARAWAAGVFNNEIAPLTVKGKKGDTIVKEDEEYKRVIYEKVPSLKSAFKQGGSITAANSSPLNDGASALVIMSAEKAKELGLTPLAKIVSYADAGVEPVDFPIAPTVALPKALEKANLTVNDIALFEINEAFSVVVRIAEKVLSIDPAKINVNGGAVALGHAIGSSGARIVVSLVHALKSGEYGAAGVCNGVSLIFYCSIASTKMISVFRAEQQKEKTVETVTIESQDGDEALRLVGTARTTQFSEEYNLKLRRKLDLLIPPLCAAVYFTQFLDKTSLNYARQYHGHYNLVSAAFYFGFLVWEFPTVYISQKLRVAKYLGANICVWGVILMLHAVGTSFGAFFALRFLLGMCESCVAPILILIISMFYKKNEQVMRSLRLHVNGISFYTGNRLAPYKIIYILLGGLAIVVGICVLIWMPDSPVHAKFLTKEERIAALERVRDDQGGTENHRIKREQIYEALLDIRTWLIVLTTLLTSVPNGGLSNFSNLIIKGFGYSSKQTLILSTPAGAVAAITTLLCGWYSDKKSERMIPIIFALVPTIIGTALLVGLNDSGQKGALLFGVYLVGTFGSALSSVYAYNASNTSGHTINSMCLFSFAIGNIIGTQIFPPGDAPAYIPGKISIMVLLTVQLAISVLLRWINMRLNKKRKAKLEELKVERGWSDEDVQKEREKNAFADMTDKQ
ncbi:MFS general substrate transporter [Favolaschia claudopus]|uniref:MFS general substrate transporter n=1 Tax=Favolaschia claudopus TaxID=2862362 RepID=A0AAW0EDR0_9AGAR